MSPFITTLNGSVGINKEAISSFKHVNQPNNPFNSERVPPSFPVIRASMRDIEKPFLIFEEKKDAAKNSATVLCAGLNFSGQGCHRHVANLELFPIGKLVIELTAVSMKSSFNVK